MKVYRFRLYDLASEDFKISARLATPACIRRIHAQIIKRSELEIDKKDLNSDGMTECGFAGGDRDPKLGDAELSPLALDDRFGDGKSPSGSSR